VFNLKRPDEKYYCRVVKEFWSVRVVVTFKFDKVFVSCVLFIHLLRVMRLNEFVIFSCCEQRWDETLSHVIDWFQFVDIKVRATLN